LSRAGALVQLHLDKGVGYPVRQPAGRLRPTVACDNVDKGGAFALAHVHATSDCISRLFHGKGDRRKLAVLLQVQVADGSLQQGAAFERFQNGLQWRL
jgi:hypothetical protein